MVDLKKLAEISDGNDCSATIRLWWCTPAAKPCFANLLEERRGSPRDDPSTGRVINLHAWLSKKEALLNITYPWWGETDQKRSKQMISSYSTFWHSTCMYCNFRRSIIPNALPSMNFASGRRISVEPSISWGGYTGGGRGVRSNSGRGRRFVSRTCQQSLSMTPIMWRHDSWRPPQLIFKTSSAIVCRVVLVLFLIWINCRPCPCRTQFNGVPNPDCCSLL